MLVYQRVIRKGLTEDETSEGDVLMFFWLRLQMTIKKTIIWSPEFQFHGRVSRSQPALKP